MTLQDDIKNLAAKSNWWKWGLVAATLAAFVGLTIIGKKDDAYKVMYVAGEIISVKVSDNDIKVLSTTTHVSITDVSNTSI